MSIARGEATEKELDALIRRRHDYRVQSEGERRLEEAWQVSEREHAARRRAENRLAWCEHFRHMRAIHYGLGDEYDAKLRDLENGHLEKGEA